MSGFLDDQDAAERILNHVENGTTDHSDEVWREPVANYLNPARLACETDEVMRRTPIAYCPSAALPDIGSYVARESARTPLVVVRGRDKKVRAFKNACRHRGTQVAEGSGCAKAFVCPYHGWTYQLDGSLKQVPHEEGFPGFDKSVHGLVPVDCEERLGMVFVTQEKSLWKESPFQDLPQLIESDQKLMSATEVDLDANWKVHLESFLEGYHIRFAHPETFYPYGYDNLNLIEFCGPHGRITYPFRRIEKLADVPKEKRNIDGRVTFVYHVFPNVVITVLSRHTNIVIIEPLTVDRTRVVTYVLTNAGGGEDAAALAERDNSFVTQTGAAEDIALVKSIQRSINSDANEHFTFGHYESLIAHFHRNLTAALDGKPIE
jgi:phenylpropionate dioxygenase-like ring-hydroxylating dioxygenase large terminal subunit